MWIVIVVLAIVVLLAAVLAVRTAGFKAEEVAVPEEAGAKACEGSGAVEKLSKAVRLKTVSGIDYSRVDWREFEQYLSLMEEIFPLVHEKMEREVINGHSLVFRWKGKDPQKKPVLVTAHMDVVPVEKGTEKDWKYDAFSGAVAEGFVWGRGTLDTKVHMITALEAAELSIKEGFIPERDMYFAFGHDEEIGGMEGALHMVDYFKGKGLQFEYLIDEGGCVTDGSISDISGPLALVGIAEKGYADIKVTVAGDGGHASTPPRHSALGVLAKVIANLENRQCRIELTKPVEEFLMKIGPGMKMPNRLILANLWLFRPLFVRVFSKGKNGNAMLRTTTAVTMAEASMRPNVLPQKASAVINFRIRHGESGADLIKHIEAVNKGVRLSIETLRLDEPSAVSSTKAAGYRTIERLVKELYREAIVAPYVMLGGTDARKYESVCENIYRFTPYRITNEQLDTVHNTNESISVENVGRCTEFFYKLYRTV